MKLTIYDPPMCCSSGVCGPNVDPKLVRLSADVAFLKTRGVEVERFNLGHQPQAFMDSPLVISNMGATGENLPLFIVGEEIRSSGRYPNRQEIAGWFGIEASAAVEKPRHELRVLSASEEK